MNKKLENLFVYGTLLDAVVQEQVIGRRIEGTHKHLFDYRTTTVLIDGNTYPAIEPKVGSVVPGRILVVTPEELQKIDAYEGNTYRRVRRELLHSHLRVFVYISAKK